MFRGLENARRVCVCVVRDAKKMVRSTVKHVGGGVLHVAASKRFQRVHVAVLGGAFLFLICRVGVPSF